MKPTGREPDPAFGRLIAHGLAREVEASGNACPDADLLAGWFDHTLSSPEVERVESHVAGCECCQQILAALARSEPEVIRAAPLPAPSRAWHWHWRWVVPLATAVLVVVVGSRTLRAPGPTTAVATPPPAQVAANKVEPAPPPAVPMSPPTGADAARAAPTPSATRAGAARAVPTPSPAGANAAPAVQAPAVVAGAAPQAGKPESQMAEMAQRQTALKVVTAELPAAPAPPPPPAKAALNAPAPTVAESVALDRFARGQAEALSGVRQISVVAPAAAGSTIAWRFGPDGTIEKSSDRGETWERQTSGVTTALSDASAPSDRVCWIVGAGGVVLRTIDGKIWQRLSPPTRKDLVAVHAWNEFSATVFASDRSGYETADGGRTWKPRK